MKATKDKKALMTQWYKGGMPTYEIALKLYVTRATLYRWLNEEGALLNRQKREGGEHHRSSICGMLAEKFGVSMPTARKYMGVLGDAEIAGVITREDLRKLGFGKVRQEIVLAFLKEAGYGYVEEEMSLRKDSPDELGYVKRLLTISEVVELFTDPGRFLNES
jgi:hypothetical protein